MRFRQLLAASHLRVGLAAVSVWLLLAPLPVTAGADGAFAATPEAQDEPIMYLHYDVEITIEPDGRFLVQETQEIQFNGQYRTAFAEIPSQFTTNIDNIQLWEGDTPYAETSSGDLSADHRPGYYAVDSDPSDIFVEWHYQETNPGDVRTFILQYQVTGGLWIYPDAGILEWRAVPADRSGFPVLESQVTVNLPDAVPPDELQYSAFGPDHTTQDSGSQVIFTSTEPILDGTRFQVGVAFPSRLVTAETQPWQAAQDQAALEYRIEAVDVDLSIDSDGQVWVAEQQRVAVDAGALYSGHREIDLTYLDSIADINLFEGDQPLHPAGDECDRYCYSVEQPGPVRETWFRYRPELRQVTISESLAGTASVSWHFPPLVGGESTTFRLQYRAPGAIRTDDDGQRLNWTAVFPDRGVPVETASVRIELPPGIAWQDVAVEGGQPRILSDGAIRLVHDGPVQPQQAWQISLTMPAGATSAPKPLWQAYLEAAESQAQQAAIRRARGQVAVGVAGVLIVMLGLLAALLIWYSWGRDRPMEISVEYLTEPPSILPPGIIAYLVDETPTPRWVLGSLFRLATLGLLRIELAGRRLLLQRNWDQDLVPGQSVEGASGERVTIPDHLVALFNAVRPAIPTDRRVPLSSIGYQFAKALPDVYAEMADEATRFFTELPAAVRHRWLSLGQWLALGGIVATIAAWIAFKSRLGLVVVAPTVGLILAGLAFMLVSRWMPQKTSAGADEAARWRLFREYLRNLKRYGDLAQAQETLDELFAYAVALDVEEVVLEQAEQLGGVMPVWTYPVRLEPSTEHVANQSPSKRSADETQSHPIIRMAHNRDRASAGQEVGVGRVTSPGAPGRLSLAGLSRQLGRTLTRASREVSDLLNTAVGEPPSGTPFRVARKGAGVAADTTWDAATATCN
ncbi:MAG: DUF2207 domain-containing protein, partial [Ardenticatenia bacterium]|nr:DUF2207 domain-containing protein [Ardenticatenia bacterium]